MDIFPRSDYAALGRYLPDSSPVAADLSDNCNLWGAHPAALAVLAAADSAAAARYPDSYANPFADAVAARLQVRRDQVATGVGASGVLDMLMRAVSPTRVRLMQPVWPAAAMFARMNGHAPVLWDRRRALDDPSGFAGGDQAIVFLANPGNPDGRALPDDWIRAVQERTEAVGSVLILDEAYGEYNREADDRTAFDLALNAERTICVKTLSKAYGLAGLRAGYGVGHPRLILEVDKARGPFMVSSTACDAAAAALASDSPWLADTVARTRANRKLLQDGLHRRGCETPPSAANFVFILFPEEALEEAHSGLIRAGVRARPFRGPTPPCNGLRATVGPLDKVQRLLDGLDLVAAGC